MERDRMFNIVTLAALALTLLVILYYTLLAINPQSFLNPFPPAKVEIVITEPPTPTAIPTRDAVATWTPTATPTITPTPPASLTPTITVTPTPLPPTRTLIPTSTPTPRVTRSPWPFTADVDYATPYYGCNWQGVGGFVQDLDGNPIQGYFVHVWGGGVDVVVESGSNQRYGDSGFEQFFNPSPTQARGVFRAQLHSPYGDRLPVSAEIVLDYEGYCSTALANIVFIKNH